MGVEEAIDVGKLVPAAANSIVVGHDGSDCADQALAMALDLADKLQISVLVARAWSIATAPRPSNWEFGYVSSFDAYQSAVQDELVRDARISVENHPAVEVSFRAVHASPAKSLIALSRDAQILVVGSRGRGGLAGMLLGSVTEQCVRHAACPVLVVRQRGRRVASE